tara:strand:+ start:739 stop:1521 length:783 start_codon:yes stop_codon:yes gene_type:complete
LNQLFVCSPSTEKFVDELVIDNHRVEIVNSAPTKDLLNRMGTEKDVVAIGGGAVIDTAKILSKNPISCFPTTAAGSSSTSWSVYWDGTKKCSVKRMLPREVILNGLLIDDLPEDVRKNTTYDVVSHCLDSMCSFKKTTISYGYCMEALTILRNTDNHYDILKAGDIAGKAIEITGTNLLHSLSYPLTGHYDIPHGKALGYFLPKLYNFMGYDVSDIIGNDRVELEFDLDFVIEEAFKYDKINETTLDVDINKLKEIIGAN